MKNTITLVFKKKGMLMVQKPMKSMRDITIQTMEKSGWKLWKQFG